MSFDVDGKINVNLDALFEQVCGILDVKMKQFKCKVVVCRDGNDLADKLTQIYGIRMNKPGGFFLPATNTIYVDGSRADEKYIMAHEITHAILSQYFLMPVSERILEVLCGFVEYEVRKYGN